LVKYILFSIENQIGNKSYDWEGTPGTIEHILPENYTNEWEKIFKEPESFIYKLGNYYVIGGKIKYPVKHQTNRLGKNVKSIIRANI